MIIAKAVFLAALVLAVAALIITAHPVWACVIGFFGLLTAEIHL